MALICDCGMAAGWPTVSDANKHSCAEKHTIEESL